MHEQIQVLTDLYENESVNLEKIYDEIEKRFTANDTTTAVRRETERTIAYQLYKARVTEAWYKIAEVDDPLISWIVANCRDYKDEAIKVLKILPATSEQLQELAKQHNFCTSWDNLVKHAQAAGVYPLADHETVEYFAIIKWFRDNWNSNASYVRQFTEQMDKLIEASVAKAKELDAAKAVAEAATEDAATEQVDDRELVNA